MEVNDENFTTVCRACMMQINQPLARKPLFSHRLSEMFTKCTNIKVDICDGLPAQICLRCFQTLHLVQSFKKQCITSDVKLKELFKAAQISLNDPYFDTEQVNVSEIKQEDDYTRDESTSTVLTSPKRKPVNSVACKSEPVEDAEIGQAYNPQTNTDIDVSEYVETQLKTSTKLADERNSSSDLSEASGGEENIDRKKENVKCRLCGLCYSTLANLKRHVMTTHKGVNRFKCDVCNKSYTTLSYLTQHKNIHDGVRPFVCDLCGRSFVLKAGLCNHKLTHHTFETRTQFPCKDCDKVFKAKGNLTAHQDRKHLLKKTVVCDTCGKMFFSRSDLRTHIRTHTKEKPHECSVCKKRFVTSSQLIGHTRTHTGNRPYTCDLCPKTFAHTNVLKNHRMTHTGEKPHVCVVCQRAFTQRIALTTHMKIHAKPPPCDALCS